MRVEGIAINEFALQGSKESFPQEMVRAIAGRTPSRFTGLAKEDRGVLAVRAGTMNHILRSTQGAGSIKNIQRQAGT